jgi:predicted nucleotidyltransferase
MRKAEFPTPTVNDPEIGEIVRRLVEAYHPLRIYLFGSVARGDAGPDSDYDIMVVMPDEATEEMRKSDRGYKALSGLGVPKDVLVCRQSWFDARLHLKASFPSTIVNEGRLLYSAA